MFYPDFPEHQKFLKFSLQGKPYKFTCLHNRLCSGPRKFTKLLKTRISWTKVRQYKNCGIYWWFNNISMLIWYMLQKCMEMCQTFR